MRVTRPIASLQPLLVSVSAHVLRATYRYMVAVYDPDTLQLTVKPITMAHVTQTVKAVKDGHFDPTERKVHPFVPLGLFLVSDMCSLIVHGPAQLAWLYIWYKEDCLDDSVYAAKPD